VTTRLVWVILFAVVVGLMLLFLTRSVQSGSRVGRLVEQMAATQQTLTREYPDSRFRVQVLTPRRSVRELVVSIQPGRADSASTATIAESTLAVVRRTVDLSGFDSLVVTVSGKAVRSVPAAALR
jgi:hypothetical protein